MYVYCLQTIEIIYCIINVFSFDQTHLEYAEATAPRVDEKWQQAKLYKDMPGPSSWRMISYFMPGG